MHPLLSCTYDAEQSTRCPPLDKPCSSAIIISTTFISPTEMPQIVGRNSCNCVSQWSLAVSFEVPDATGQTTTYVVIVCGGWLQREQGDACRVGKVHIKQGRVLCGRCDLWHGIEKTRVTCVSWQVGGSIKWPSLCGSACVVRFRPEQICAVTDSVSEQQWLVHAVSNRGSNGTRSWQIKVRPDTVMLTNVIVTGFGDKCNLVRECQTFVRDKAKISRKVGGVKWRVVYFGKLVFESIVYFFHPLALSVSLPPFPLFLLLSPRSLPFPFPSLPFLPLPFPSAMAAYECCQCCQSLHTFWFLKILFLLHSHCLMVVLWLCYYPPSGEWINKSASPV